MPASGILKPPSCLRQSGILGDAMKIRLTVSHPRATDRGPWRIVGEIFKVFGWTVEGIEEVREEVAAPPSKTPEEVAAEQRAAVERAVASLREERKTLLKIVASLGAAERTLLAEADAKPPAPKLTPLPVNVFALPRCETKSGRHTLRRTRPESPEVVECAG
jgi:hypothetical protein